MKHGFGGNHDSSPCAAHLRAWENLTSKVPQSLKKHKSIAQDDFFHKYVCIFSTSKSKPFLFWSASAVEILLAVLSEAFLFPILDLFINGVGSAGEGFLSHRDWNGRLYYIVISMWSYQLFTLLLHSVVVRRHLVHHQHWSGSHQARQHKKCGQQHAIAQWANHSHNLASFLGKDETLKQCLFDIYLFQASCLEEKETGIS